MNPPPAGATQRDAAYVRDSSLSAAIQAIMAAEVGHLELAYDYLSETALIDLRDLALNTRDGLHLAALAGAWLAAAAGFGAMRDYGQTLSFAPRLPPRLTRLSFGLLYRGRRLRIGIDADAAQYELLDGKPLEILHHGESITVTADAPQTRPLPRTAPRPAPSRRRAGRQTPAMARLKWRRPCAPLPCRITIL